MSYIVVAIETCLLGQAINSRQCTPGRPFNLNTVPLKGPNTNLGLVYEDVCPTGEPLILQRIKTPVTPKSRGELISTDAR